MTSTDIGRGAVQSRHGVSVQNQIGELICVQGDNHGLALSCLENEFTPVCHITLPILP